MTIVPTDNEELDKLLLDVKRTILENRLFLENLKQEPISEGLEAEEQSPENAYEEPFEEL
ncbi:MAG: hypothetical protein HGB32_04610 [Geobacteraceae bacterium]|nr:hypothetical protein [Geobacteraceae bacterium]NTW79410.1 hypothetical protein [Geobacteraceae bacterium]